MGILKSIGNSFEAVASILEGTANLANSGVANLQEKVDSDTADTRITSLENLNRRLSESSMDATKVAEALALRATILGGK